jgi:hypothetical protein
VSVCTFYSSPICLKFKMAFQLAHSVKWLPTILKTGDWFRAGQFYFFIFCRNVHTRYGSPSFTLGPKFLLLVVRLPKRQSSLKTHFHLEPSLRMNGGLPPRPLTFSYLKHNTEGRMYSSTHVSYITGLKDMNPKFVWIVSKNSVVPQRKHNTSSL